MTLIKRLVYSLGFICLLGTIPPTDLIQAQSVSHLISVPVDQTTIGDLGIMRDFFDFSPADAKVSQSLRRIFMAAIGEMTLATTARITPDTVTLTLDDGSIVPLLVGDTIQAQGREEPPVGPGPIFVCTFTGNPHRRCQPLCVCNHIFGSPVPICIPVPPVQKDTPVEACPIP